MRQTERVNHRESCGYAKKDYKTKTITRCGEPLGTPCPLCKRVNRIGGGDWVSGSRGGQWFRPDGWKPKKHFGAPDPDFMGSLCGTGALSTNLTTDRAEVTCKSCLQAIERRQYKIIAFIASMIYVYHLWLAQKGGGNEESL